MFLNKEKAWEKEIEELRAKHRIEMGEKEAALKLKEIELEKRFEMRERELVSLLKIEQEQKLKKMEIGYEERLASAKQEFASALLIEKEKLMKESYDKLSNAMSKLHEEGNVTTRFTQDLALKMMESLPTHKVQTKVITSGSSAE